MEASSEGPARRRRFGRRPPEHISAPTPCRLALLRLVADFGLLTSAQLCRLSPGMSEKGVRRQMRDLYDSELVDLVPVSRAALADPTQLGDPALIYGSAPNLFVLSAHGARALRDLCGGERTERPLSRPRSGMFLAHRLAVTDVRIWLELCARRYEGHRLESWAEGAAAAIQTGVGRTVAAPDAWFRYRLGEKVLVGMLELDRGTERGDLRWKQKVGAYQALFSGGRLPEVTGYANARVLVVAPDAPRRDRLAELVAKEATAALADRFWLAVRSTMLVADLSQAAWGRPRHGPLSPLVHAELLRPEGKP